MGMTQQFPAMAESTNDFDRTVDFLDHNFPLGEGSHSTAASYLVYFDHLLVIHENGLATGLRNPSQFIEANGNYESPQSILLESHGLQVELDTVKHPATSSGKNPPRRIQLQTQF